MSELEFHQWRAWSWAKRSREYRERGWLNNAVIAQIKSYYAARRVRELRGIA